jgi:sugar lactone lactonase YvrE
MRARIPARENVRVTKSAGSQVEVAVDIRTEVGEGPHWDAATQSLWFVDLTRGTVCRYDRVTGSVTTFSVGQEVGAVLPRRTGGLVLAVRDGIASASDTGDGFQLEVPVERENIGNRMNDAKCDPVGRLFAGTTAFDFATGAGALYRIDIDWSCEAVVRGVTTSNGTAWAPDGTLMYFIDSGTQAIDVFDYDVRTGSCSDRRRLVTIEPGDGIPDGMTVDADGNLWVACFGSGAVRCYEPSGKQVSEIAFPVSQVTSCAFGGSDLSELFVTSGRYRLSAEQLTAEPLAGSTFVCRPGVVGIPASSFAGGLSAQESQGRCP